MTRRTLIWVVFALVLGLLGARVAIALDGAGRLASSDGGAVLDAVLLAAVLLAVVFLATALLVSGPQRRLSRYLASRSRDGVLFVSSIDPQLDPVIRSWTRGEGIGPWPWAIGVSASPDHIRIWRPARGDAWEILRLDDTSVMCTVNSVWTPLGKAHVVDLTVLGQTIQLSPRVFDRGLFGRRMTLAELKDEIGRVFTDT